MCIYTDVKLPVLFAFMSLIRFLPLGNSCCFPQRKASSKWITPPILQINSLLPLFSFPFLRCAALNGMHFWYFCISGTLQDTLMKFCTHIQSTNTSHSAKFCDFMSTRNIQFWVFFHKTQQNLIEAINPREPKTAPETGGNAG